MKLKLKGLSPSPKFFKYAYSKIMLFIVGRAIQAAYRYDQIIQSEVDNLPENHKIALTILNEGPSAIWQKDTDKQNQKRFNYLGSIAKNKNLDLDTVIKIKNIESGFRVLSFQESTTQAEAYSRYIIDGPLENVSIFIRILDRIEILLLPRMIAKLAVKRYKSGKSKHTNRIKVYLGILTGSKKGVKK